MRKYIIAMTMALFASFQANASYVQGVTGADMVGISVTVEFANGSSESAIWQAISATAGGAFGASDWALILDGDSFGEYDSVSNTYYGLFNFFNGPFDVVGITLDILSEGFVFDTAFGDASANGSGAGREFVSSDPQATVSYGSLVEDELYGTLDISAFVAAGTGLAFMTDTDAMAQGEVPAPAGLLLVAFGLLALRATRRAK
ncbi:hypothetical protein FJ444_20105 [Aestuariibacter sp. GS-14]|uniref:hypothetical protein n=1 Tax=Aestuariibacter sp. GS-14 TaxID=2590670 RepID=UPI001126087C|nr:hypothetical protein [Aestuariibacter sp. GS-14]TPV53835.1 hypothetical protein FJ444_20105 [Aestuariibacter sp. GS-14]